MDQSRLRPNTDGCSREAAQGRSTDRAGAGWLPSVPLSALWDGRGTPQVETLGRLLRPEPLGPTPPPPSRVWPLQVGAGGGGAAKQLDGTGGAWPVLRGCLGCRPGTWEGGPSRGLKSVGPGTGSRSSRFRPCSLPAELAPGSRGFTPALSSGGRLACRPVHPWARRGAEQG